MISLPWYVNCGFLLEVFKSASQFAAVVLLSFPFSYFQTVVMVARCIYCSLEIVQGLDDLRIVNALRIITNENGNGRTDEILLRTHGKARNVKRDSGLYEACRRKKSSSRACTVYGSTIVSLCLVQEKYETVAVIFSVILIS